MMNDSERDQLLSRLDERTENILSRLEKGDKCMDDLKFRVGKLEAFQATLIGIAATISIAITTGGYWLLNHLGGTR